jgi:6-pyruvoyltetrahydropterin/6-carboxytetrahydropterin synthase
MMYEVSVEHKFAAGHALRNYKGRCENVHGHNWRVEITVTGEKLDSAGMLVDFIELKRLIDTAVDPLDHRFLNEIPPFDTVNPSAENIAEHLYAAISSGLEGANDRAPVKVSQVRVWETDDAAAVYRPK